MSGTVKPLLHLSVPAIFGMLGSMAMNMVDTAFGGHLGPDTLAGLAVGDAILMPLAVVCSAIMMGGMNFVAARAHGAGNVDGCHQALVAGVYIAVVSSLVAMVLVYAATWTLVPLGMSAPIATAAATFARNLLWGILPGTLVTLLVFYLQSMAITAFAIPLMVVGNLINAFGDWLLMTGNWGMPAYGIAGIAWSTNCTRILQLVVMVGYVLYLDRQRTVRLTNTSWAFSGPVAGQMGSAGGPFAVQQFLHFMSQMVGTLMVGSMGVVAVASYRVVTILMGAAILLAVGLSSGCAALVGQRIGAKDVPGAARAGWTATALAMGTAFTFWIALVVLGRGVLKGFTPDPEVIELGMTLVMVSIFIQAPVSMETALSGALRAAGDAPLALLGSAGTAWLVSLPLAWVFAFPLHFGLTGFWIGFGIGKILSVMIMAAVWRRRTTALAVTIAQPALEPA